MLLETTIKPRRDGNVLARFGDVLYTFCPGADGTLACEVGDEAHVKTLLESGNFYPAAEGDFAAAADLVAADDAPEITGDEGEAQPDDEGDDDAPLIEMPTPNRGGKKTKAK